MKITNFQKTKILQIFIYSLTILYLAGAALSINATCKLRLPLDLHCNLPPAGIAIDLPSINGTVAVLNFIDQRLATVYPIIQKFKSTISSDPTGVTKTWIGSDICSYRGFFCDNPPDNTSAVTVASVDFNGFGLSAPSLSGFLDQLPDLALFHANSNNFSGTLSPKIAQLKYLYEFDISNNRFSGPFPTAVLGMEFLIFLDIRFNLFSGLIPPQIFTQNIEALFINNNDFVIKLPDNIGATHVIFLTLANNKFNGPLPTGLFKALSSVSEILLINDQLTGCIPYEVGYLRSTIVLNAANNQLTGRLPLSLACLDKVEQLDLANNLLFGMVPEMICGLENLVSFSLSGNYFTIVGPMCRVLIERGVLDVRNNCINDLPYQRSVQECSEFFLHPRFCPRIWSFNFLPCVPSHFSAIPQVAPSP